MTMPENGWWKWLTNVYHEIPAGDGCQNPRNRRLYYLMLLPQEQRRFADRGRS